MQSVPKMRSMNALSCLRQFTRHSTEGRTLPEVPDRTAFFQVDLLVSAQHDRRVNFGRSHYRRQSREQS